MIQPIRPNEAAGIYQRQIASAETAADGSRGNRPAAPGTDGRSDQVTISRRAQQLSRLLDAVIAVPDVREARVAFLRQQIAEGRYEVDLATIAERLLEEGLEPRVDG